MFLGNTVSAIPEGSTAVILISKGEVIPALMITVLRGALLCVKDRSAESTGHPTFIEMM